MLLDLLWKIVSTLINPVVSLLPITDLTGGLVGSRERITSWLHNADMYVPILTPMQLIVDVLQVGAFFVPVAIAVWLYRLIPGKLT